MTPRLAVARPATPPTRPLPPYIVRRRDDVIREQLRRDRARMP